MSASTAAVAYEHRSSVLEAATEAPSRAARHLTNLDLLRAVAVCLVFVDHLTESAKIRGLGSLGHLGVLLFFVHTSYVLMLSMGAMGLSGSSLYKAFLIRRLFRIFPLSVLAVLLAVGLHIPSIAWLGRYVRVGGLALISNLLLIQNLTHTTSVVCVLWSLPFEVQMYLTLPAIYLLLCRFPSAGAAWLAWLAGISISVAEYLARNGSDPAFSLFRYFPCFLAGVLAWRLAGAQTAHRHGMQKHDGRLAGWLWAVALLVLVLVYRLVDGIRVYGPGPFGALGGTLRVDHATWWPPFFDLGSDWVFCILTALAIPCFAAVRSSWLNAVSKRVAQYSYGIYVSHVPLLWLCFKVLHFGSTTASAIVAVALTGCMSVLLYHWIEHPAVRLGKRLAAQFNRRTAVA